MASNVQQAPTLCIIEIMKECFHEIGLSACVGLVKKNRSFDGMLFDIPLMDCGVKQL